MSIPDFIDSTITAAYQYIISYYLDQLILIYNLNLISQFPLFLILSRNANLYKPFCGIR